MKIEISYHQAEQIRRALAGQREDLRQNLRIQLEARRPLCVALARECLKETHAAQMTIWTALGVEHHQPYPLEDWER